MPQAVKLQDVLTLHEAACYTVGQRIIQKWQSKDINDPESGSQEASGWAWCSVRGAALVSPECSVSSILSSPLLHMMTWSWESSHTPTSRQHMNNYYVLIVSYDTQTQYWARYTGLTGHTQIGKFLPRHNWSLWPLKEENVRFQKIKCVTWHLMALSKKGRDFLSS